jgi:hypothetical protein
LATSNGEFDMDLEWPPQCPGGETDEECKQIVCDGVQTFLQENLCTGQNDDCEVVVPCYEVTQARRKLDAPKTNLLHRALASTGWTLKLQLIIPCENGDCSDDAANTAAAVAAMGPIQTSFGTITNEEMIAGIKAAILALDPPPASGTASYFNQLSFQYDPSTSTLSNPTVFVFPPAVSGFEFVGPGSCKDSAGKSYGYLLSPDSAAGPLSFEQCAPACLAYAGSTCWTAAPPLRGMEYTQVASGASDCYCLFEVTSGRPTDLFSCSAPPAVYSSNSNAGVGPVFTSNVNTYTCYKYIG